ncbi:MAG TPA: methyltransferase domain-containing protein, partial [Streptosporangiaceae bacterium]
MAAVPPARTRPSGPESHQAREVAESFGTNASRYDRARPDYPGALVERIVAASPGPGPVTVLDVGCGTGIVARQFQAAGCEVLGVDPDERMAGQARERGLEVEVATFETWDPAGRAFGAVVAGQAWHWVDPVAGAARAALALRPGGRFAVFWNVFQPPAELGQAFAAVYRRVLPDLPANVWDRPLLDIYETIGGKAADGMRQAGAFGEPERWYFEWSRPYTRG